MSDEKFESAEALKTWLIDRDVDSGKAAAACTWLFAQGYDQPSALIGIEFQDFDHENVSKPVARHISNKLKEQQHQPDGDDKDDALAGKMRKVFNTKLSDLSLLAESRVFHIPDFLNWTASPVPYIYWRKCYTYLLCSLIAGLESQREAHLKGKGARAASFIVTGTQGTGKSVLGVMTALVLHEIFGWQVHYVGNSKRISRGDSPSDGRQVDVFDLSDTKAEGLPSPKSHHTVIFSSCNKKRWEEKAQQTAMSQKAGNFLFIDLLSEDETVEAATQLAACKQEEVDTACVRLCYAKAGGIARFCLSGNLAEKAIVDAATDLYLDRNTTTALADAVKSLIGLNDTAVAFKKTYPGLILHYIPQSRFKNSFLLRFGSPEIRQKLCASFKAMKNEEIETLLTDLMRRNESRGLAGVVYEEWVNSRATLQDTGSKLVFAGAKLPATKDPSIEVHEFPTAQLHAICFQDFNDLDTQLDQLPNLDMPIYGFSRTRIHEAIDGIILFLNSDGERVLAGVQYTTAAKKHPVSEKGVMRLYRSGKSAKAHRIELWFTQPQQCLDAGASVLVRLQPLKFAQPKERIVAQPKERIVKKSAKNKSSRASLVVSAARTVRKPSLKIKTSNKQQYYWEQASQNVHQFVMITSMHMTEAPRDKPTEFQEQIRVKLENASEVVGKQNVDDTVSDLSLRPWNDTLKVAHSLLNNNAVSFLRPFLNEFIEEGAGASEQGGSDMSEDELTS